MKNVISVSDLSGEDILDLILGAEKMIPFAREEKFPAEAQDLVNSKVTLLFVEPSTRTLGSFAEAARRVGISNIQIISGEEATSLIKKESLANTVRMMAIQGAKVLVIRTKYEGSAKFASEILAQTEFKVSVINGGDGANQHPSQTLLDLLTIKQKLGRLDHFTIGGLGDLRYSRTLGPLLQALSKISQNIKVKLVSAPETRIREKYKKGLEVEEEKDISLLKGCHIVYVTRIQEERFADAIELAKVKGLYIVNQSLLDLLGEVLIMHPQPCNDEIDHRVYPDPRIIMNEQAWYGIPSRMHLIVMGSKHRFDPSPLLQRSEIKVEVIKEVSIEKHLAAKRKEGKYFKPIKTGTVIDHLPSGSLYLIKTIIRKSGLPISQNGAVISVEGVYPLAESSRKKDVLVLENTFISDQISSLITFFAPEATFNILKEGCFQKKKIGPPSTISDLFKCPNPVCICNNDPEAKTRFRILKENKEPEVYCDYCERSFLKEDLIKETF